MTIRHLVAATDYRRMPWKNGGGETIEVGKFPEEADLAGFDWRISMAAVASDGPFSIFPGIDRTLAVLTGRGMVLDIEGRKPVGLTVSSKPLAFAADAQTAATLLDGPLTDLNLMTRRSVFTHHMEIVPLGTSQPGTAGAVTVLLLKGRGKAGAAGGVHWALADTDALVLDAAEDAVVIEGTGILYRMEIHRAAP